MIIQLFADDPRLGKFGGDGSIQQWPVTDVFERPYERTNATVQRLSETAFVVIGSDQGKHIDEIRLFEQGLSQVPADEVTDVNA